ncbi:MAG TPA: hypothetical protein VG917_04520 [Patescibacteria group bacterium]|nr:hypothetical protein [Patescibacteria group bacterium]
MSADQKEDRYQPNRFSQMGLELLRLDPRTRKILTREGIVNAAQVIAIADEVAINNRIPDLDFGFFDGRSFENIRDVQAARESWDYDKPSVRVRKAAQFFREQMVDPGRNDAGVNRAALAEIDRLKAQITDGSRLFELVKRGIVTPDQIPQFPRKKS